MWNVKGRNMIENWKIKTIKKDSKKKEKIIWKDKNNEILENKKKKDK